MGIPKGKNRHISDKNRTETRRKGIVLFLSIVFFVLGASVAIAQECGCNVCHGNPPIVDNTFGGPNGLVVYPLTGATSAGAHAAHVPVTTGPAMNDVCYKCHVGGMPYSSMCGDNKIQLGFSVNGSGIIYDGRVLNAPYSYATTTGTVITLGGTQTCSNLYCHSNGTGGTNNLAISGPPPLNDPRPVAPGSSPSWRTHGALGCNFCHGYPPSYLTNSVKSNSHLRAEHQQTCNFCHYATTTDGVTITNPSNHANGLYNVQPDPTAIYPGTFYTNPVNFTYTYSAGGGRCDNVSCHPGGSGMPWGNVHELVASLYPKNGTHCFEMLFDNVQFADPTDPPYTYYWDFGDGTTGGGLPTSHIYSSAGPFTVSLSGTDKDYHPYSTTVAVTPQGSNAPPVLSKTLSLHRYTMTITDASYDPDCSTCGHTGNGKIEILWDGNNTWTRDTAVNLCSPTNNIYTHTYPSVSANYNLKYYVTDNAGMVVSSTNAITLPGPITISGSVTHAGGSPFPNVTVYLYNAGGTGALTSVKTDSNGAYTLTRTWTNNCYDVRPISGSTVFTPTTQSNICDISSNVNFVGP